MGNSNILLRRTKQAQICEAKIKLVAELTDAIKTELVWKEKMGIAWDDHLSQNVFLQLSQYLDVLEDFQQKFEMNQGPT